MHEIVHEDVTEAFLLCGFARPHDSYLRTMLTITYETIQLIDFQRFRFPRKVNFCEYFD